MNASPYSDYRYSFSLDRITWAVQRLILLNIALFVAEVTLSVPFGSQEFGYGSRHYGHDLVFRHFVLSPDQFFGGKLWQPLTSIFLHANLSHLVFNMVTLFFFGPTVERMLGTRQMLGFYVFCGALGGCLELLPGIGGHAVLGASGAVMGVLVAFAMINPDVEVRLLFPPVPLTARGLVIVAIALNVVNALGSGVAWLSHFGGMGAAYLYMKFRPALREWALPRRLKKRDGRPDLDKIGEAIDNIFRFDEEKRRRK